jgi:hypothetical protein
MQTLKAALHVVPGKGIKPKSRIDAGHYNVLSDSVIARKAWRRQTRLAIRARAAVRTGATEMKCPIGWDRHWSRFLHHETNRRMYLSTERRMPAIVHPIPKGRDTISLRRPVGFGNIIVLPLDLDFRLSWRSKQVGEGRIRKNVEILVSMGMIQGIVRWADTSEHHGALECFVIGRAIPWLDGGPLRMAWRENRQAASALRICIRDARPTLANVPGTTVRIL